MAIAKATDVAKDMTLEVRRSPHNDEGWGVWLNGTNVVGFLGPDARARAEHQRDELATLMNARARGPDITEREP